MKKLILLLLLLTPHYLSAAVTLGGHATSSSSSAPLVVTFSAPAAGTLIYPFAGCRSPSAVLSTPSGYTAISSLPLASLEPANTYFKVSNGSETSVTFSWNGAGGSCDGFAMIGTVLLSSTTTIVTVDGSSTPTQASNATSIGSGSFTTTTNNAICFAPVFIRYATTAPSAPMYTNSFTGIDSFDSSSNNIYIFASYQIFAATGSQSTTTSWTTAEFRNSSVLDCFKEVIVAVNTKNTLVMRSN